MNEWCFYVNKHIVLLLSVLKAPQGIQYNIGLVKVFIILKFPTNFSWVPEPRSIFLMGARAPEHPQSRRQCVYSYLVTCFAVCFSRCISQCTSPFDSLYGSRKKNRARAAAGNLRDLLELLMQKDVLRWFASFAAVSDWTGSPKRVENEVWCAGREQYTHSITYATRSPFCQTTRYATA